MDDDPDPEKASSKMKAKDELNIFSDSSGSESEDDGKQLNQAGKELKAMLKVRNFFNYNYCIHLVFLNATPEILQKVYHFLKNDSKPRSK